eukprot:5327519-Prymnesium_polylepis.1
MTLRQPQQKPQAAERDADGFRRYGARRSGGRRPRLEHGTAAERRRDVDETATSGGGRPPASRGSAAATQARRSHGTSSSSFGDMSYYYYVFDNLASEARRPEACRA